MEFKQKIQEHDCFKELLRFTSSFFYQTVKHLAQSAEHGKCALEV